MPPKRAPRSRSRQTTPQSPPKQSASNASPRRSIRGTRSRSHEINQSPPRQKPSDKPLAAVDEESDPHNDGDNDDDDDEIEVIQPNPPSSSGHDEIAAVDQVDSDEDIDDSSSDGTTQLESLDIDLIVNGLQGLHHTAIQILSLLDPQNTPGLIGDLGSTISKTSKLLRQSVTIFNASREPYGSGSYINVSMVIRKLTLGSDLNEGPWRPDAILQLANLSVLVASLSQSDETSIYDTLERMFNTFPEPFGYFNETTNQTRFSTKLTDETVAFGIALRTQFFLKLVERTRNEAAFDPDAILEGVFFDDDGSVTGFQPEGEEISPKAENAILSRINNIRKHFTKKSTNPIQLTQLKNKYSWNKFLTEAFRWSSLRRQELENQISSQGGVDAIRVRLGQGDLRPYRNGDTSAHVVPEAVALEEGQKELTAVTATPNETRSSLAPSSSASKVKWIARLKELKASDDAEDGPNKEDSLPAQVSRMPLQDATGSPSNRPRTAVTEIPQSPQVAVPKEIEDDADAGHLGTDDEKDATEDRETTHHGHTSPPRPTQGSIVPTQQTLAVLQVAREQEALSNKENINTTRRLFTDKQTNAKRLQWDDTQPGQKRTRQETESDDDESDEFETDERPQKRTRHTRPAHRQAVDEWIEAENDDEVEVEDATPPQPSRSPRRSNGTSSRPPPSTQPLPQRSPLQHRGRNTSDMPPSSSAPQLQQRQRQPAPQPQRPRSSSPTDTHTEDVPPSTAHEHMTVNAQAKATMRMRPMLDPARNQYRPQVRRAWTVEETNRLFEMIGIYGCAWATILSEDNDHVDGPELQLRTQVQLKDKARNLKMDYLKAGAELPDGFAAVSIKSSDKELLRGLGLPFE